MRIDKAMKCPYCKLSTIRRRSCNVSGRWYLYCTLCKEQIGSSVIEELSGNFVDFYCTECHATTRHDLTKEFVICRVCQKVFLKIDVRRK